MAELKEMEHFSIKQMYLKIRGELQKVEWRRLVCNNIGLPRWIMLRLATLLKLYNDRLIKWKMALDPTCPQCNVADEIHSDLSFACSVAAQEWKKLLSWVGIPQVPGERDLELSQATTYAKDNSSRAEMDRMVLAAAMYHLWRDRN
ncbi:hypothetical protein P3L10_025839 [Capsicum annuum]|uniref:uncharacterized protein LOC107841215 n=1 Tax=Capsicum annuum TaxID=4072 RepID=UPI0007BEA91E|nr:uncharacterized protein LOC107841215 [Capsicum annuum]